MFVIISYFLTHRNITFEDYDSEIRIPFLIYLISIIPSFINVQRPFSSILMLYHLVAFFLIIIITKNYFTDENSIKKFIYTYLILVLANTLYLFYQTILVDKRTFGFTGIMYVDYVGIAVIITLINLIFKSGVKKIIWGILFSIFTIGLIVTQTRSSWLVTATTTLLFGIYLFINSAKFNISKFKLIISASVILIFISILIFQTTSLNPKIAERAVEYTSSNTNFDKGGLAVNSLVSRMLIWTTAVNAFIAHPFVGIGVYAFPYTSYLYNKLPKYLFDEYVNGLSAHLTFLAVAVETGIIGLIGFLIFLFSVFKNNYQLLKISTLKEIKTHNLSIAWSLIYIIVSMFVTDAWLWGQGILLFGIFIGLMLSKLKFLKSVSF
ncbi:MAG: O-antigen ligase family protein [Bacteroidetes bacterium]|nr:O-antigen ligase family protein [Bacteroidota bacterium]